MGGALPAVDAALVAASGARRAGAASATDDDRALAARAATDPEAFAQLYRRYVGPVYELAHRRSRSREVAEDVTSATFEKALQSMERFEWRRGGFRAWLYRIAANELTDHFRRRSLDASPRAQRSLQALAGPGDDGGGDGFEAVDQRLGGEGERVLAALDGPSPRARRWSRLELSGATVARPVADGPWPRARPSPLSSPSWRSCSPAASPLRPPRSGWPTPSTPSSSARAARSRRPEPGRPCPKAP